MILDRNKMILINFLKDKHYKKNGSLFLLKLSKGTKNKLHN